MMSCRKRQRSHSPGTATKSRRAEGSPEAEALPDFPAGHDVQCPDAETIVQVLTGISNNLALCPFGIWAKECRWHIKRELFKRLPKIIDVINRYVKLEQARTHLALTQSGFSLQGHWIIREQTEGQFEYVFDKPRPDGSFSGTGKQTATDAASIVQGILFGHLLIWSEYDERGKRLADMFAKVTSDMSGFEGTGTFADTSIKTRLRFTATRAKDPPRLPSGDPGFFKDAPPHLSVEAPSCMERQMRAMRAPKEAAIKVDIEPLRAYMFLMEQVVQSGYAQTSLDRRMLVDMGAYNPGMLLLQSSADARVKAIQVQLYVHLAEFVAFYEEWGVQAPDFWSPTWFSLVLRDMPNVFVDIPADISADQWEMYSSDLEGPLRTIVSFLIPHGEPLSPTAPMDALMSFLEKVVSMMDMYDKKFGAQISAKSRGAPLEELIRLSGILWNRVLASFEDRSCNRADVGRWAAHMIRFLFNILMLEVPTCIKSDSMGPGRGDMPSDERQLDAEWIECICDRLQTSQNVEGCAWNPQTKLLVSKLLDRMVNMSLAEQRYRFECIAPLIPVYVHEFREQLKQRTMPQELFSLKTVINTVFQDDASVGSDLLEEISLLTCLLEFPTKRALIHAACERTKLQGSNNDPIRLVVPRDNVLDGVCTTLNLQDQNARIDVPLEIEFRAGYADGNGNELADEGEDQGGLRRQWLDRASRYFITSDLFVSPSEEASHLEGAADLAANRVARGKCFMPAAEQVCRCVQDDWQEQFELFGCVLGFAILYKETIPVHFGHAFLRSVFGLKTKTEDLLPLLENVDKTLHTKLKYILGGTYSELGDTLQDVLEQSHLPKNFSLSESRCPELVKNAPLKEDGEHILVVEENKEEFVTLLLERVLIKGVARQVDCFRRGLLRAVPEDLVHRITELMTVKEIELMVCGADGIDVDDWEQHTNYENGYTASSQPVIWFWEVVKRMTDHQRAAFLAFATGASQVPSGGFRFLQPELFTIQRVAVTDRYPEAHTCANMVDLPEYTSLEELEEKLHFAVSEAGDYFGRR